MEDAYEKELTKLLVDSFNLVSLIEKNRLKGIKNVDLSINELHLIDVVGSGSEGSGMSVREIAKALEITMPSVTVSTRKLEDKGILKKTQSDDDKRVVRVALTPLGTRFYSAHRYFHVRMIRSILTQLQEEDKPAFMNAIRNLHAFFLENSTALSKRV